MSAGLPVIAYDCTAGPSEMISNNKDGFLIPVFDDRQFKNKLEILLNREDLRKNMGEKAKENIKKFNIDIINKKYLDFLISN